MKNRDSETLIAILEDDAAVAQLIANVLREFSMRTIWYTNATALLKALPVQQFELCIIDLILPDMDGIEAMQRVVAQASCGILILTSRSQLSERVLGLELGADDYVIKPFEPRELVARIRSILRRCNKSSLNQRRIVEFDGWIFNLSNNRLYAPNGDEQSLSMLEAEVLKTFVQFPNRILKRETLLGAISGHASDRSIDVRVSRLRNKLQAAPDAPEFIKTVYGAGYLFSITVKWLYGAADFRGGEDPP